MDSEIYSRAVERIAALKGELQRLEGFVATFLELATATEITASRQRPEQSVGDELEREDFCQTEERPRATPQTELERVVEQVIENAGTPLHRGDLLDRVKALGVVIGGRNEAANFGSKLSRASRLVNLPRLGYWPKDRPYEPGGYRPKGESLQVAA